MHTEAIALLHFPEPVGLITMLLSVPLAYLVSAYGYLAWWHKRPWLFNVIIHENGRLTLLGSVLYFDHFVACVPMVSVFALCSAGGMALTAHPLNRDAGNAGLAAFSLLAAAGVLVIGAFVASVLTVGWQRTLDYSLQRIERDGVTSKGGNWNQLQLSNVPIALGTIGIASALRLVNSARPIVFDASLFAGGAACLVAAAAIVVGMSVATWCTWRAFRNPRWLAHSMREVATFPLTGIPIALASIVIVEYGLFGPSPWAVQPRWSSLILIGLGALIVAIEFALVRNVDVLAIAQKPSFAAEGMSISYLLAAHVFEHVLDFVLIALLAGGLYALVCWLALG